MRFKLIIGICVLFVAASVYLLNTGGKPTPTKPDTTEEVELAKGKEMERKTQPDAFAKAIAEANLPSDYELTAEEREKILNKERQKAVLPTMEELKIMMDTPVEFYGQVLDQFDQPVVGASIRCSWPYMGPMDSALELQSTAPNGQFEIAGIKAFSIGVSVYPPPGYDEQVSDSKNIQIAKAPERIMQNELYKNLPLQEKEQLARLRGVGEAYKPDKAKPMIFRLKKL